MKRTLPLHIIGALIFAMGTLHTAMVEEVLHRWTFDEPAGTLMTATANSGSIGGVSFVGGHPDWTTNGMGGLEIRSNSGDALIQSNANMGPEINGIIRVRYDISWNFANAVPGFNREIFLISRTSSGSAPAGNQFRFALSNWSASQGGGGFIQLSTQTAGVTGPGDANYRSPVQIAPNLEAAPTGSVSLRVTYTFDESNTMLMGVAAEYTIDGGDTWMPQNLGGDFTPYNISNLGDLRIHAKGPFNETNYYRVDAVTVSRFVEDSGPPAGVPQLMVLRDADSLRLQWPASHAGWQLQYAPELDPMSWSNYVGSPAIVGDRAEILVPPTDWSGRVFFRLADSP